MNAPSTRTALILGASGLVGGHCLKHLLDDPVYSEVTVLVRRPHGLVHPKLKEHIIDFKNLDAYKQIFQVTDVFSCLGVKGAVSSHEFRQVELIYPARAAELSADNGVSQFLVVSAMLSSPRSSVALFRVKGELEAALKKTKLNALHIFRPALIMGDRETRRSDEEAIAAFLKAVTFFARPLRKFLYIQGKTIAFSMCRMAKENLTGLYIYNNPKIQAIHDSSVQRP